jgi:hypothetical protein
MADVPGQECAILAEFGQASDGKKSGFREGGVCDGGSVAFAHDEPVTLGPIGAGRVDPKSVPIQHGKDVGN